MLNLCFSVKMLYNLKCFSVTLVNVIFWCHFGMHYIYILVSQQYFGVPLVEKHYSAPQFVYSLHHDL